MSESILSNHDYFKIIQNIHDWNKEQQNKITGCGRLIDSKKVNKAGEFRYLALKTGPLDMQ